MKKLILLHVIIEICGGLALIFNPDILMLSEPLTVTTAAVIKLFGVLVFTFGLASLLIYRTFEYGDKYRFWVLLFMGYHFIQSLQCYAMYNQEILTNMSSFSLHLAMALFFMFSFMSQREKYD